MADRWWAVRQISAAALRDLARSSPATVRAWLPQARAIAESLGVEEARAYTRLLLVASADPAVATQLAMTLPDLIASVAPGDRPRFHQLMVGVLEPRPSAAMGVARNLPTLLDSLEDAALAHFVAVALEKHAASPRVAAAFLRLESATSQTARDTAQGGVYLSQLHRTLSLYAMAHCGGSVVIRPGGNQAFTDGRHLYLPDRIDHFGDERDRVAFWVLTAMAAGFIEFGSLDIDLDRVVGPWPEPLDDEMPFDRMTRGVDNPVVARTRFLIFERTRVVARTRSTYPGVARRMDALGPFTLALDTRRDTPVDRALKGLRLALKGEPLVDMATADVVAAVMAAHSGGTTVHSSVEAMVAAYPHIRALMATADEATASLDLGFEPQAMTEEDKAVEASAAKLLRSLEASPGMAAARSQVQSEDRDGLSFEEMSDFLDRLEAPSGPRSGEEERALDGGGVRADKDVDLSAGLVRARYPEWDATLTEYKPRWATVTEYRLRAGDADFVNEVMVEHGAMIARLRRTFSAIRPQSMRPKRGLSDGESLDMDAVIAAKMAHRVGVSAPHGLYRSRQRMDRDVSVAFLVDMSSSTNEHINTAAKRIIDVEREALVVTAEAVHALGDPMAIYGYSGFGRDQVAFYVAKDFDEPWGPRVRERIGRISWKMENRDGAAIRHAVAKITAAPGKVKLLILLSDGKPLDCGCDQYSDQYAQEDTRMALIEARRAGIHPFCITVDPHGRGYLRRMYGEHGYIIIDSVDALPLKLPAIYRRLTSR